MRWRGWRGRGGSRGCDDEGLGQGIVGELHVDVTGALALVREAEPAVVLSLGESWREVDSGAPDIVWLLVGSVAHELECVGRSTVVDDLELHLFVPQRRGSAASVWQCAEPGSVDAYFGYGVLCVVRALECEMPAVEHDADQRAAVLLHGRRQGWRGRRGMTKLFDRRGCLGGPRVGWSTDTMWALRASVRATRRVVARPYSTGGKSRHALVYSEIFPPMFRVLAYSTATYFAMHLMWVTLASAEERRAQAAEIEGLRTEIRAAQGK